MDDLVRSMQYDLEAALFIIGFAVIFFLADRMSYNPEHIKVTTKNK